MYCPKCGTENADDAQLCRNCSWVLTSVRVTGSVAGAKTSALAITSMVLGILSFCTFFLTAPVAVILGIISLVMISRSGGYLTGKGFAIAGIVVPVVALPFMAIMMGIMLPALARVREMAQRQVCAGNMSALGKAMLIYANDYDDKFPTSSEWCDLLVEYADVDEHTFRCAGASGCSGTCSYEGASKKICNYAMNKNIEKLGATAHPNMVLLFETKPGWNQSGGPEILSTENHNGEGCNILFNDGRVKFVMTRDINDLKWTAEPED